MSAATTTPAETTTPRESAWHMIVRRILTERVLLLALLLVVLLIVFSILSAMGSLYAPFDVKYLSTSLISLVPLTLLALAQMFVITSGRSGIDLSVGGIVSLGGMLLGWLAGPANMSLPVAIIVTIIGCVLMGSVNGVLIAYLGFPPLISTLATGFAFASLAMLANGNAPFAGPQVASLNTITDKLKIGDIAIPMHVFTIMLPCILISWFALTRTRWGRSLFAVGTNHTAAKYAAQPVKRVHASAYLVSGALAGVAAVVNVAQFASARPDAGTAGNGLALPAITIAVLGGVAIRGGIGSVGGTSLAALFITWLNAAILISFQGSMGPRVQLLALGCVLIGSVMLNSYANRRYGLRE